MFKDSYRCNNCHQGTVTVQPSFLTNTQLNQSSQKIVNNCFARDKICTFEVYLSKPEPDRTPVMTLC